MPYNLFITRPNGVTFKTLRSPYDSRADSIRTARMFLEGIGVYDATGGTAQSFAQLVAAYPLGETITHKDLGVSFRTELA